jgi:uracil-DNA glycosylase
MTDPLDLLQRYVAQRQELGEPPLILEDADLARALKERSGVSADARAAADAPATSQRRASTNATDDPAWRKGAPEIPAPGLVIPTPDANLFAADPLADATLEELEAMVHACTKCPLCEGRTNAVPGEGPPDARLMVVGEGPGANEDAQGRPFVGRAGELLNQILAAIDCPRETVYIANIVKCRPPNNRNPERDEIAACIPYLYRQIALVAPTVIVAMGSTAACALLETRGSLSSLRNKVHHFRGTPLVVTYHPAALLRNPHWKKPTWDDVRIARRLLAGDV